MLQPLPPPSLLQVMQIVILGDEVHHVLLNVVMRDGIY